MLRRNNKNPNDRINTELGKAAFRKEVQNSLCEVTVLLRSEEPKKPAVEEVTFQLVGVNNANT